MQEKRKESERTLFGDENVKSVISNLHFKKRKRKLSIER
jgi:hypothetical protein